MMTDQYIARGEYTAFLMLYQAQKAEFLYFPHFFACGYLEASEAYIVHFLCKVLSLNGFQGECIKNAEALAYFGIPRGNGLCGGLRGDESECMESRRLNHVDDHVCVLVLLNTEVRKGLQWRGNGV